MDDIITKEDIQKTVRFAKSGLAVHSNDIAKIFGKSHDNVIRLVKSEIVKLLVDEHGIDEEMAYDENGKELNASKIASNYKNLTQHICLVKKYFTNSSYINSRGKEYIRFELTRKGFDYVALSFTGKKARQYKRYYIDEFHNKESTIKSNKEIASKHKAIPFMVELREEGKKCRKELMDSIQKFDVPLGVEVGKDEAEFLRLRIINYTKMINKLLNIKTSKGVVARDILEGRELLRLEDVELKASRLIEKHHTDKDMDYKKLYQRVKVKLEEYCE